MSWPESSKVLVCDHAIGVGAPDEPADAVVGVGHLSPGPVHLVGEPAKGVVAVGEHLPSGYVSVDAPATCVVAVADVLPKASGLGFTRSRAS